MTKEIATLHAGEFFREYIDKHYGETDWECWETSALAIITVYLQQDIKNVSFKRLYNLCQYRELVRLAELFTWSEPAGDIQTLLHVCRNRQAHQKFFSVVKACFENKAGNIPYFGKIDEENNIQKDEGEKVDLAKIEREAEKKGWNAGFEKGMSGYRKFAYKYAAIGSTGGIIIGAMWTALYFVKF